MDNSKNHCHDQASGQDTVSGFLTTAVNMEDQISSGMYEDYMKRANWPAELDEKTFVQIKKRLTTLVEDTKKHSKILQALIKEHAKSK